MAEIYLVTLSCPDRSGLVAAIASRLFDLGANLRDTTFAVYGTEAEFTSLVAMPAHVSADTVAGQLRALDEAPGATVSVEPFRYPAERGLTGHVTHVITVSGGDQPGLIARIAEVFGEFGANIVHLQAAAEPGPQPQGLYTIRFSVYLAPESADGCLATVANTAEAMNLACTWERY